jgi:hypothetical protein
VGELVGHLIDESKAANELVGGNGSDVRLAFMVKFDSKMMLEDVGVGADVKRWA